MLDSGVTYKKFRTYSLIYGDYGPTVYKKIIDVSQTVIFSPSPAGIYSVWREWRKVPDLLKLTVITENIFMPMEFNILVSVYFPWKFILRKEFTLKLLQYFTSPVYQYISTVECKKWIFELKLVLSPGDKWYWICPQSCLLSLYAEYSSS